jgi:hypothetical protein
MLGVNPKFWRALMDGPVEVEIGRIRAEAQGVLRQVKAITADAETALRDGNLTPAQGDRAKARLSELNGRLVPLYARLQELGVTPD